MSSEKSIDEQLEEVGGKLVKYTEKIIKDGTPKAEKLLTAFSNWLDKKLEG